MTPAQLHVLAVKHREVQEGKGGTRRQGGAGDLARLAAMPMGG